MNNKAKHPLYHISVATLVSVSALFFLQQYVQQPTLIMQVATALLSGTIIFQSFSLYAHSRRLSKVRK